MPILTLRMVQKRRADMLWLRVTIKTCFLQTQAPSSWGTLENIIRFAISLKAKHGCRSDWRTYKHYKNMFPLQILWTNLLRSFRHSLEICFQCVWQLFQLAEDQNILVSDTPRKGQQLNYRCKAWAQQSWFLKCQLVSSDISKEPLNCYLHWYF